MKKKNGFTLIEIMVVIVIMGILAAVGVPKLFGLIAKAKVSEIHTVVGTYIHAQDAHLHGNNIIGSWKDIGFAPPASKVFEYSGCVQSAITPQEGSESVIGLLASNRVKLNDCLAHGVWAIVMTPLDEHHLDYQQVVSPAECASLTPNWSVGTITSGECPATEAATPAEPNVDPEPDSTPADTPTEDDDDTNETPEQNDQCSDGSSCSNSGKCSLGGGATAQGKQKNIDCGKSQFSGCCACCK